MKSKFTPKKISLFAAVFALCCTASIAVFATGGFFGSIFTSFGDGTTVNGNIYPSKADVYLNGGPQNLNSKGLPDGTYYFQVTDPSGATLLSTDNAECRQVLVVNGKFAGGTGPCPHANGALNLSNGTISVQLIPFDDTPNNGGEYKAWLIRQGATTIAADGIHLNFVASDAKTDNFKVKIDGGVSNCETNPELPECHPPLFSIGGLKFFDINADGILNGADFLLAGVRIRTTFVPELDSGNDVLRLTHSDGSWSIGGIPRGTDYYVREDLPNVCPGMPAGTRWVRTVPLTPITLPDLTTVPGYDGTVTDDVTGLDFGNRCETPGSGGRTLGFWSNKNGQALISAADRTALTNLHLRNYDGSNFDPTTNAQIKSWLLSGNAVNMSYMLSVQLTATTLSTRHGLDGSQLVDVGGNIDTINNFMAQAEVLLAADGMTFAGDSNRAAQEAIKNILDAINNNNFVVIQLNCRPCYDPVACTPTATVTEDTGVSPEGGLVSFAVTTDTGSVTVDHVNAGTGLQAFTVVSVTNAVVTIPPFIPGTYNPVTATYTVINPALPVDITLKARSSFHGVIIQIRCADSQ